MRRTLYRKLILIYVILAIAGFTLISTVGSRMVEDSLVSSASTSLYREATQIASKQGDLYYHSERSLTDLYNSLSALASYHNSQIWLISADGEILLNTAAALDEENPEIIDGFDPVALGSEYYSTGTFFGYFEDKMLSVMVPVTSDFRINGYVAIHLPLQDVYQQRESLLARIDFLFLLVFGLSFVILIFFSLVVYRPLKKIINGAKEYASGNLTHKIDVKSHDEMGYLASTLNYMSGELNKLLEAMGATVRLNDNTAWDEESSGNTPDAVSSNVFNADSGLTKSMVPEQTYCQCAGCTVNPGNGTWLVKGRDTTCAVDADADGQDVGKDAVLLAFEELPGSGKVYVSGGLFLSDDAMKEPDNIWKSVSGNQGIVEALLKIERAACPELVTIGEMRSGKAGEIYHIRGWATSGTSHPGNTFSKTIYLQDDTGGVALVPFTGENIEVGTPIEVVGRKEIRGGNVVLKIIDYEVLDEPLYNYTPKTTPNKTAMDYEANGGRLMQVEGRVKDVTYSVGGKGVSRITLKDGNGDLAEILIEDDIVSGADGENDLASQVKEGRTVRAIGLLHLDGNGTPVLRVRNCDEVVYVPPVPVSLGSRRNPRTGDLIWIAVGVMVLSGIGLAVLLRKRKR